MEMTRAGVQMTNQLLTICHSISDRPYHTVLMSYHAICSLILNKIILYNSIPYNYSLDHINLYHTITYNLSFDIKQTTQNYTIPHPTVTYRMVPFVFWYQTARIWRIWQGPQRPVGILTPSTKYKTTSSTCVSAFDQVEDENKSSASILVREYVKYCSLQWQHTFKHRA